MNTAARQKQRERKARKALERAEWAKGADKALVVAARLAGIAPTLLTQYQSLGGRERWNKRRLLEYWVTFIDTEPLAAQNMNMPADWLTWIGVDKHRRMVEQWNERWNWQYST